MADHPKVDRKGAKNPYTSVNGNMFSFLGPDGTLGLRLSKEEREKFLVEHNTELIVSYNTVMKEYVAVPEDILLNPKKIQKYFGMSYDYASSLKPKPSKRKSKPKKSS